MPEASRPTAHPATKPVMRNRGVISEAVLKTISEDRLSNFFGLRVTYFSKCQSCPSDIMLALIFSSLFLSRASRAGCLSAMFVV